MPHKTCFCKRELLCVNKSFRYISSSGSLGWSVCLYMVYLISAILRPLDSSGDMMWNSLTPWKLVRDTAVYRGTPSNMWQSTLNHQHGPRKFLEQTIILKLIKKRKTRGSFYFISSIKRLKITIFHENLLHFVSNRLNGVLFKKMMPTLQAVCGGQSYVTFSSWAFMNNVSFLNYPYT